MALPARFSLLNARFDEFLFAPIGEEESGMPLSVASALARLGSDPWTEAGRLARLPRAKATEALASIIAQVPRPGWKPSDVPGMAANLISLLPGSGAVRSEPRARSSGPRSKWSSRLAWLLCLALIAGASFGALSDRMQPPSTPGAPAAMLTAPPGISGGCGRDCRQQLPLNKEMQYGQRSETE
jgi:hypothetical protein